jgi:hypothetical protein
MGATAISESKSTSIQEGLLAMKRMAWPETRYADFQKSMLTKELILTTLDNANDGHHCRFVRLDEPYNCLYDSRVHVFRGRPDRWAIAIERVGFRMRKKQFALEIYYHGNCLVNLETRDGRPANSYDVYPIEHNSFNHSLEGWSLKPEAREWIIRDETVFIQYIPKDYFKARITPLEIPYWYSTSRIRVEAALRLITQRHRALFRATDDELYKSVPRDLKKIMTLDEWYHRDFNYDPRPPITVEALREIYDHHKKMSPRWGMTFDEILGITRAKERRYEDANKVQLNITRPSLCETWNLLADVLVHNDPSLYKPTRKPNSHWKNYPYAGVL